MRTHRSASALAALLGGLLAVTPAGRAGSIITYSDRAAWTAAAGAVTTETFDEFGAAGRNFDDTVTLDGVTYRSGLDGVGQFSPFFAMAVPDSPPASDPAVFGPVEMVPFELQFGGAWVAALGMQLVAPRSVAADFALRVQVDVLDRDGVSSGRELTFTTAGPHFFGITATAGVVQVVLSPLANTAGLTINVGLDDVSHTPVVGGGASFRSIGRAVPAPPGLVLLGLGLAGTLVAGRKGRRVAA